MDRVMLLLLLFGGLRSLCWLMTGYWLWRARQNIGGVAGLVASVNSLVAAKHAAGMGTQDVAYFIVNLLSLPVAAAFMWVAASRPDLRDASKRPHE